MLQDLRIAPGSWIVDDLPADFRIGEFSLMHNFAQFVRRFSKKQLFPGVDHHHLKMATGLLL